MLKAVIVTIDNPTPGALEFGSFSVTCSPEEAFTLLTMPAFDGLIFSLVPEYTDALSPVHAEEEE